MSLDTSAEQISVAVRQRIDDVVRALLDVRYPTSGQMIDGLSVYSGAFKCLRCDFVCLGNDSRYMAKHCKEKRGWTRAQPRGKPGTMTRKTLWLTDQRCQRFFETPGWHRYFLVAGVAVALETSSPSPLSPSLSPSGTRPTPCWLRSRRRL
jgi:hypothetical protein